MVHTMRCRARCSPWFMFLQQGRRPFSIATRRIPISTSEGLGLLRHRGAEALGEPAGITTVAGGATSHLSLWLSAECPLRYSAKKA